MISVGSYEAKTRLSELLQKVIRGEVIEITKHGVPVAHVVPVNRTAGVGGVIDELRSFRKGKRLDGIQLKDLISEGRE